MTNELLSTSEAARRLGMKPQTIRQMLKDGRLSGVRAGNRLRVTLASLEAFIERNRTAAIERSTATKRDPMPGLVRALLGEVRAIRRRLDGEAS